MGIELDEETIKAIHIISEALKQTSFKINRFTVGETGAGGVMIDLDIRRHNE